MRLALCVLAIVCALNIACGSSENTPAPAAPGAAAATPPPAAPPPPPPPFLYPAPVKGHYKEVNTGDFDLVDGVAYTASNGKGTVVFVTEKSVASPVLAASTCPMTQLRAVALIRNSGWAEVTIDGAGRSKFYTAGTQYDGSGRSTEVGSREWTIKGGTPADGRIAGTVTYRRRGTFEFDLPVATPGVNEVSESDRMDGQRVDQTRRAPTEAELLAAYASVRKAALAGDLKTMLELQGFNATQVAAIRGLPGIDAELAAHADRFLDPGAPEEPTVQAGRGAVGARGKNSKGAAFFNFYEFVPCGEKLVMTSIGLNPQ